jgi:hypothetical protein
MKQYEVELRHAVNELDTVRLNYQTAMTSMGTELQLAYAQIRIQQTPTTVTDGFGGTSLRDPALRYPHSLIFFFLLQRTLQI